MAQYVYNPILNSGYCLNGVNLFLWVCAWSCNVGEGVYVELQMPWHGGPKTSKDQIFWLLFQLFDKIRWVLLVVEVRN